MTEKQRRWQIRNRLLWEIRGLAARSNISNVDRSMNVLTSTEVEELKEAFSILGRVVDNSTQSSIELGFNAVKRCRLCGKPVYQDDLCKKHFEENESRVYGRSI